MIKSKNDNLTLLDCTLRDGGYYTSWYFDNDLVEAYLDTISQVGINIVEIGFRTLINKNSKGPYAFTQESMLRRLDIPDNLDLAVMVNASEIVSNKDSTAFANQLFPESINNSKIKYIRIAACFNELEAIIPFASILIRQGYKVIINFMQIATYTDKMLAFACNLFNNIELSALYFADSLGSLNPSDVIEIVKKMQSYSRHPIGIHAHDNMNKALVNTLAAIECNASYIDTTIMGIGRGAGNVKTEEIVLEVFDGLAETSVFSLTTLTMNFFQALKNKYQWGSNIYYYLAGKYDIHPSYIQTMLNDNRFSQEDRISVINLLKNMNSGVYRESFFEDYFTIAEKNENEYPHSANIFSGLSPDRDILLLGTGPSIEQNDEALKEYISKYSPFVLALNTQNLSSPSLIDARIACHPLRLLADINKLSNQDAFDQPLIVPFNRFDDASLSKLMNRKKVYSYPLKLSPQSFSYTPESCTLNYPFVFAYSLAFLLSRKCSSIHLAGFDGYPSGDRRNNETLEILELYKNHPDHINLVSITPTYYQIDLKSVHGLV